MKKLILSLLLLAFLTTPVYAERMRKYDSIASQDARYLKLDASNDPIVGNLDIGVDGTGYDFYIYSDAVGEYWEWLEAGDTKVYGAGDVLFSSFEYLKIDTDSTTALWVEQDGVNDDVFVVDVATADVVVGGDMGIFDGSPKLSFADSSDDTAYCWHLDTADTTWGYYQLWRGTDADGKSFAVSPNIPLMYFDTSNVLHTPYGIDADTGNITTTGTVAQGGTVFTPSAAQVIEGVGDTILANATMIVLNPDGDYTLTSTPTIANGTTGQILYVTAGNGEANTVTVQDQGTLGSSNLELGGATRDIMGLDVLTLLFDGTNWIEVSYAAN